MDRDDALARVEEFLDEAEENAVEDFEIDDNYDSIRVVAQVDD